MSSCQLCKARLVNLCELSAWDVTVITLKLNPLSNLDAYPTSQSAFEMLPFSLEVLIPFEPGLLL